MRARANADALALARSLLSRAETGKPETRVLVVEDEPDIANLIRRYLERAGYGIGGCAPSGSGVR